MFADQGKTREAVAALLAKYGREDARFTVKEALADSPHVGVGTMAETVRYLTRARYLIVVDRMSVGFARAAQSLATDTSPAEHEYCFVSAALNLGADGRAGAIDFMVKAIAQGRRKTRVARRERAAAARNRRRSRARKVVAPAPSLAPRLSEADLDRLADRIKGALKRDDAIAYTDAQAVAHIRAIVTRQGSMWLRMQDVKRVLSYTGRPLIERAGSSVR